MQHEYDSYDMRNYFMNDTMTHKSVEEQDSVSDCSEEASITA